MQKLYSVAQAAKVVGVTPQALHRRISVGKLAAIGQAGRWVLVEEVVLAERDRVREWRRGEVAQHEMRLEP